MDAVMKYFPELTDHQRSVILAMEALYQEWNARINLISRKDMDHLFLHHVVPSMSISRVIRFSKGTRILDIGTGGGFPGIPLAVLFPDCEFTLIDSTAKKIIAVYEIVRQLGIPNVNPCHIRAEEMKDRFEFITGRAVAPIRQFCQWAFPLLSGRQFNDLRNGVLYLTGGDMVKLSSGSYPGAQVFLLSQFISEPYFGTKKLLYIPGT